MGVFHSPVLLAEVMEWLAVEPADLIVDMTLGGGGYSQAILERLGEEGKLIAFDRDQDAVDAFQPVVKQDARVAVHHSPFSEAANYLALHSKSGHDGAVLDLGVSSHQLDTSGRGFSFRQAGPLDMRMDGGSGGVSAADLVNQADAPELARIFRDYGEEKKAWPLAQAIVARRQVKAFSDTLDFASVVESVVGLPRKRVKEAKGTGFKHPATRTFQALRVAVNQELRELKAGLEAVIATAKPGARIVVVAYHSLEDRIVKHMFRDEEGRCRCPRHVPVCVCGARARLKVLTPRPIRPSLVEVQANRRARSALLRVAERVS